MKRQSPRGRLFVFEGLDGSGKTTIAHAFVRRLRSWGWQCDYVAFPGKSVGSLGKLVYDIHHDPRTAGITSVTPTSLQVLHIAAHIDAIESEILPALNAGRCVVLDRYWWSTWVYGVVAGVSKDSLDAMIQVECVHWAKVLPDTVFVISRNSGANTASVMDRQSLSQEYAALASRERLKYPVTQINNDGTTADSLTAVMGGLPNQQQLPLASAAALQRVPLVFTRLAPAKPTIVYDTYWRFAAERQSVFFARLAHQPPPWTSDPILQEYKFTNAYRASDRVSQYLIRHVIYDGDASPEEVFFRTILFKVFNRIETWERLVREVGTVSYATYSFRRYDAVLSKAMSQGERIYSAAYIMPSGGRSSEDGRKHSMHLKLIDRMMREELPARIADARSMGKAFELLRTYPTIGDFLAYQYVTDLNYSALTGFSEMEFVAPGPGALNGIRKCFSDLGGLSEADIIKVVADRQQMEFARLGLTFKSLWGRPLQLIDCQNLFCEVDKYARVKHPECAGVTDRKRIKQKHRLNVTSIAYWYPPKWGLNDRINMEREHVSTV
jgi:thymidylate kinase